jgi:hypothetical protein
MPDDSETDDRFGFIGMLTPHGLIHPGNKRAAATPYQTTKNFLNITELYS